MKIMFLNYVLQLKVNALRELQSAASGEEL
jgi:hypothetical protein